MDSVVYSLTPQEEKAVLAFKDRLLKEFGDRVVDLRLFGSRARGEGDEESDLDLLVLLKDDAAPRRSRIFEIAADILLEHEIDVSPLAMTEGHFEELKRRERLLPQEIERDGQRV